jgi:hypothetical protein
MVLAINALQVAVAEENVTYTILSAYQRFFANVLHNGTYMIFTSGKAISF